MTAQPDADELAVRSRLHKLLAAPTPAPDDDPDPDDWWDQLYGEQQDDPEPDDEDDEPEQAPATAPASNRVRPAWRTSSRPRPRQSLLDAWDGTTPRLRWLIYHGTAASLGWGIGLVGWSTQVTAWIAADRYTNPQSITCYAIALAAIALYRRTRGWWWPVAWMAAVPISSIALGALLYGTAS